MLEFYFLPCSISVWHLGLWGKWGLSDLIALKGKSPKSHAIPVTSPHPHGHDPDPLAPAGPANTHSCHWQVVLPVILSLAAGTVAGGPPSHAASFCSCRCERPATLIHLPQHQTLLLRNRAPQSLSFLYVESTPREHQKQSKNTEATGSPSLPPHGTTGLTLMKLSHRRHGK